ncbi:Protein CBG23609 [Caenorhabditis briggsae]|uniref:Protein CBG23609 n=1 Tax=Caenorhabditis briggsae TaxID=6238 RepID=A8WIX8_CAEBR|nr:Protein CBG23609 [Caenorhabditis briggsae]CAP20422.2 Protein CBG23609 [Caenorhabditis briggsae]
MLQCSTPANWIIWLKIVSHTLWTETLPVLGDCLKSRGTLLGGFFLLIFYRFQTGNEFDMSLIRLIVGSFMVSTILSIFDASLLSKPVFKAKKNQEPYLKHLSQIVQISFDRNMLLLLPSFVYTGIEMSFYFAVFPTMVSFTKSLGNTRDLNIVAMIFVGFGNICGCFILSFLGARVREIGRKYLVLMAACVHLISFILLFLSFPDESPLQPTESSSFLKSRFFPVFIVGLPSPTSPPFPIFQRKILIQSRVTDPFVPDLNVLTFSFLFCGAQKSGRGLEACNPAARKIREGNQRKSYSTRVRPEPPPYSVVLCGVLIGFGDAIINQQCYTILNDIYDKSQRVEAFAVYRFYQSLAGSIAMLYSAHVLLKVHVTVLITVGVIATATFFGIRIPKHHYQEAASCDETEKKNIEIL